MMNYLLMVNMTAGSLEQFISLTGNKRPNEDTVLSYMLISSICKDRICNAKTSEIKPFEMLTESLLPRLSYNSFYSAG